MQESPLFAAPVREEQVVESSRVPANYLRRIRRGIARFGLVATVVASLAGASGAIAAPPFDAQGCNNGNAACLATGGVLYPYLADPNVYLRGGYGVPYGVGVPYGNGFGFNGFGYNGFGYGPSFGYNNLPSGQCYFSTEGCEPYGSPFRGYNIYPPPTAKPFSAFPSTALVTPPPPPIPYAPYAPPPFPAPGVAVATLPPPAPPGIPAPPNTTVGVVATLPPPAPPGIPALPQAGSAVAPGAAVVTATARPATATPQPQPAPPPVIIVPPVTVAR